MIDLNKKPAEFVASESVSAKARKFLGLNKVEAGKPGSYAAVKPAGVVLPPTYTHMDKPSGKDNIYVPEKAFYRNDGHMSIKSKGFPC